MSLIRTLMMGTMIVGSTSGCMAIKGSLYASVGLGELQECANKVDLERARCEQRASMSFATDQRKKCEMLMTDEKKRCFIPLTASTIPPYERESR